MKTGKGTIEPLLSIRTHVASPLYLEIIESTLFFQSEVVTMIPSGDDPAGSSSGVAQHFMGDTPIRSRHPATDAVPVTAPAPRVPTPVQQSADDSRSEQYETNTGSGSESPHPSSPSPGRRESPNAKTPEEKQCRICFAGAEEEAELGRLISPCLCRGSIRYVHVSCLKQWRVMSQSSSAFWSCPQCGFRYALARTRALGLATSPGTYSFPSGRTRSDAPQVILSTASVVLFTIIVLLSSFLATWFVPDVDSINEPVAHERARDPDSWFGFGTIFISPLDYYTYSWNTASDVFKLAIRSFSDISNTDDEFWKKDETDDNTADDILDDKNVEKVQDSIDGFKNTVKVQKSKAPRHKRPRRKPRMPPSRFARVIRGFVYRFTTGLGVVGILSFLNLMFSFGMVAPLRLFGGNRGQRRGAANDTASLVMLVFVVIGLVRAIWLVYKLTRHIAQLLLRRAETAILEVGQVEDDFEPWPVYLRRVARELPARIKAIPYRLLPRMVLGWAGMALVQAWHTTRDWTRDAMGQIMQVGPQPQAVPQRGIFLGDW
ncbi:hypothetical protein FRC10_001128 [Ceratobasidium sp. 414]|nr:hypothetical protein FRC10_001128 [Ceratobasidium sp. 414]